MPFGAQLMPDGRVRFRLWAPAARRVELVLEPLRAPRHALPLEPLASGWFEIVTGEARAGTRYRYGIDGGPQVPDPASRYNPQGVHGPSEVVDAGAFDWPDAEWRARPWREAVIYELHVGTFTPQGTFTAVESKLEHLRTLGVTAIELMPVGEFAGTRGWGYDGVLPYAPASAYGTPQELKSLVAAAHRHGLAVMLDVVYNHFGPEGNYLHLYAPQFFTTRHATPWGAAIDFEGGGEPGEGSDGAGEGDGSGGDSHARPVREYFIHNALYWLEEYHFDGLRIDAAHAIFDSGDPHILTELARAVRAAPRTQRPVYLVLENVANEAHHLGLPGAPDTFDAQWNDDFHHGLHVLLTGESDGYYRDFEERPGERLCKCLAEGFAYQGEWSQYHRGRRGEPSAHLPPSAFVNFLQNHDQVGNRARGERLSELVRGSAPLKAAAALLLLAPSPPMLFMGEEWAAPEPFTYFCDFEPELAEKVRQGRRREFAEFAAHLGRGEAPLPDPVEEATRASCRLDWARLGGRKHARMLGSYRRLLAIRRRDILPQIPNVLSGGCVACSPGGALAVDWKLRGGGTLHLVANLTEAAAPAIGPATGRLIYSTHPRARTITAGGALAPWSVTWRLESGHARA